MTKLSEMPFKSLRAGMKFFHPRYGEQVILDLDRNSFGPVIKFHNCDIFSGKMPEIISEEEDIYQLLAKRTFPCGAEEWEYMGMITSETLPSMGWRWFEVTCPHCGSIHNCISSASKTNPRQCLVCGMVHSHLLRPSSIASFSSDKGSG